MKVPGTCGEAKADCGHNSGVDAARVVAIFFVVITHVLAPYGGAGGNDVFSRYLAASTVCCVDLFALISGFVGGQRLTYNISRIVNIWVQVFFTGACTLAMICLFFGIRPSVFDVMKVMMPVLSHEYWYVTSYAVLLVLMPLLNAGIQTLGKRKFLILSSCLFIMVVFLPAFNPRGTDTFRLAEGFSPVWLILLYLFGVALQDVPRVKPLLAFTLAAIASLVTMSTRYGYTQPSVVLTAVFLLLGCANLKRCVGFGFLSSCAFGVYLWHSQPKMVVCCMGCFHWMTRFGPVVHFLLVIGVSILVFLVCCGLEYLRMRIFAVTHLDRVGSAVARKIKGEKRVVES